MQPPCTSRTIRPLGLKTAGSHEIFVFFSPPIFQRHVILFPPNSSLTYFPPHTVYHYAFLSNLVRFVFLAKKEGRERENYTCAYKQRIDRSACKRSKIFMTGLVKKKEEKKEGKPSDEEEKRRQEGEKCAFRRDWTHKLIERRDEREKKEVERKIPSAWSSYFHVLDIYIYTLLFWVFSSRRVGGGIVAARHNTSHRYTAYRRVTSIRPDCITGDRNETAANETIP